MSLERIGVPGGVGGGDGGSGGVGWVGGCGGGAGVSRPKIISLCLHFFELKKIFHIDGT